jgi:hypothetical protein
MDRIFSARLDEGVVHRIHRLAHRLHIPKKRILERAVRLFSEQVEAQGHSSSVLDDTFGAWRRKESARSLVEKARSSFRRSMERQSRS